MKTTIVSPTQFKRFSSTHERVLNVTITELGEKLKEDAVLVPKKMGCCVCLEKEDADELYRLLHKVLGVLGKE